MPDRPPQSPPLLPESVYVCIKNPKPNYDSEDPSHNHKPSTPEIKNPPAEGPIEPKEPSNSYQEQREEPRRPFATLQPALEKEPQIKPPHA